MHGKAPPNATVPMEDTIMTRSTNRLAAGLIAAIATASLATGALAQAANNDLAPGLGAGKVLSAQLGIKGPTTTVCPNQATMTGWVYTDYKGPVTIMIARKGQSVGAPITLQTIPASNGKYVATYNKVVPILTPVDAEYRLLVGGGSGIGSNWVRLKASCAIGLGGGGNLAPNN